jgi:two-component system, LuxR family, sensor kinase FixL
MSNALDRMEKLEAENSRFRDLLRQAPGFVAIFNGQDHRYAFANDAYYDLVAHQKVIGRPAAETAPAAVEQDWVSILDKVFLTGEVFLQDPAPVKLVDRSGAVRERYLNFLYQPVRDKSGKVEGVIRIGHDVTDEVKVRAEATRLRAQLIHVSRMSAMGTMASSMAHEVNQPLAAAGSYLSGVERLLRNTSVSEGVLRGVSEAQRQVQRAGDIIRRVREFIVGKRAEMLPVSLSEALNEVVTLLRSTGEWANVAIDCNIEECAETIEADQIQLEQVFLNIIRNALQAAASHEAPHVQISARREAEEIIIMVCDNGPGLGDRAPDSVFSAFSSDKPGGLGIGLSISRTIVEAHGGSIIGTSAPSGACFTVSLPATPS